MSILQKLYIKNFLVLFLIITAGLAALSGIFDLIGSLEDFMPNDPDLGLLFWYTVFVIPKYLSYLLPLSALLSGLFTIGQASKNREITVYTASGGRVKVLLIPFLVAGIALSGAGFLVNEYVMPPSAKRAKEIAKEITKKKSDTLFSEGRIWLRAEDGSIVRFDLYIPEKGISKGLGIFTIEDDVLTRRIEAHRADYDAGDGWVLRDVVIYNVAASEVESRKKMGYAHIDSPEFLNREVSAPEEMGIGELSRYVAKLNEAGFRNVKLLVDLNAKVSYPTVNLFMLAIGISFTVRRHLSGLLAGTMGLLISLFYWISYTMSLSLGYASILPPIVAAWTMPIAFSAIAAWLFHSIPE